MNVARRAIEILDERGWCQGVMEAADGRVCLHGALNKAGATKDEYSVVRDVIGEQYPNAVRSAGAGMLSIAVWNDPNERTVEHVRAVLEKAAVRLDELA